MSVPYALYAKTSGSSTAGPQGETGATGIQGETGAKGDTGTSGIDGANGVNGSQGIKGDTSAQGDKGNTGTNGADGAKGDAGENGEDGMQGAKGDTGDTGAIGPTGGNLTLATATTSILLTTDNQFIVASGKDTTITLPSIPVKGQIIHLFCPDLWDIVLNPNGKRINIGYSNINEPTRIFEIVNNRCHSLSLIYYNNVWFLYASAEGHY